MGVLRVVALLVLVMDLGGPQAVAGGRWQPGDALDGLAKPHTGKARRQGSADPTGANKDFRTLKPGESVTIFDQRGAGVVRRFFFAFLPRTGALGDPTQVVGGTAADVVAAHRQTILRMYWDGEREPSVQVPIGDFFVAGFGTENEFVSAPVSITSGGFSCYWPMPFHRSARWTLTNVSPGTTLLYWYHVDYTAYDTLPKTLRHFHAQWRRENPTTPGRPYTILEARGRGHYVGTALFAQRRRLTSNPYGVFQFLEGDEQISIDGESSPSIAGSGTEEYFNSGFYFDRGPASAPYHGIVIKDVARARTSTYRWHVQDAIPFARSIRVAIEHGSGNDLESDYASVAYWYQEEPHAPFPNLPDDPSALLPSEPAPP